MGGLGQKKVRARVADESSKYKFELRMLAAARPRTERVENVLEDVRGNALVNPRCRRNRREVDLVNL
jgi:hypothetical protein